VWRAELPEPAQVATGGTGSLTFNDDGSLRTFSYDGGVTTLSFDPGTGAVNPVSINLDVGESGTYNGLTQFESPSTAVITNQDGFPMGKLENVTFDKSGILIGIFSNGETQTLGQLSLAEFTNESGLVRAGDNMYTSTNNSGTAVVGTAGVNINGQITPGAVELSNVELSTEFANMIPAQRGFQANSRIITTSDKILEEVLNLKR
jgi:flagellar hook protein FlgE